MADRRSGEEVQALAERAKGLVEGGMSEDAAAKEVGIARSVYDRRIKGKSYYADPKKRRAQRRAKRKKGGIVQGKIDVSMIPPRPKRMRGRTKGEVNPDSVASIAHRIDRIDVKLASMEQLRAERAELAHQLLLKLNRFRGPRGPRGPYRKKGKP